jgi:hypothetical protein
MNRRQFWFERIIRNNEKKIWNIWKKRKLNFRVHDVIRYFMLPYFFQNATLLVFRVRDVIFHVRDLIFHVRDVIFRVSFSRTFSKEHFIFVTESIFYKFYYFPKFSFSAQNLFLLSIPQHVIASKSNHINTMFPNEMILAPLQKLKIKYELSYQSTTRLKYIDKFD